MSGLLCMFFLLCPPLELRRSAFITYTPYSCLWSVGIRFFVYFFWDRIWLCCSGWGWACGFKSSSASASWVAEAAGLQHSTQLGFHFLIGKYYRSYGLNITPFKLNLKTQLLNKMLPNHSVSLYTHYVVYIMVLKLRVKINLEDIFFFWGVLGIEPRTFALNCLPTPF